MIIELKDGTSLQLDSGNTQNQFVVRYENQEYLDNIEKLLTDYNLSDAKYIIDNQVVAKLKNKSVSGSRKDILNKTVTYFLIDISNPIIEELKKKINEMNEKKQDDEADISNLEDAVFELTNMLVENI